MQIVTSWMLEGIEEGRQEGRQEGEVEILLRLLRRRFGEVAIQLEERISQLSIMPLENLAEVLLDFEDERDLVAWLQDISVDESS